MDDQVNLEGYSNLEKIGEGGMSLVYRGIQDSLNRPVAIKILTQELGDHDEARRRFERESYIIARLNHPNIIHVIDRGITPEGMPYFVMEYIEGIDLNNAVDAMKLDHYNKLGIFIQLLKALSYAHRNNVIHRDIKPDNILVDEDCNIKVLDFGIAQFYEEQIVVSNRTSHGTVMGTYNYMSPEQRDSADNVTIKSDIYSVGVLMYKLFTDEVPVGHFPEPSRLNPEVSQELDRIILQCLRPDPQQRPDSAETLKIDLLSVMKGAHIQGPMKQRAEQGIAEIKSKFRLLDILREDRFGAVYLYQQKFTGKLLIIKKKASNSSGFDISSMFADLKHKNIIPTLGTSKNDQFFILVQEYLSGGTLQDKLAYELSWKETLRVAVEICQGMAFAHKNSIIHGHLRPTNILFTNEAEVKLTDFGLQDDISDVKNAQYYSVADEPRSVMSDIYSVGVILYQLFTGNLPQLQNNGDTGNLESFNRLPSDIRERITTMLSPAPLRRDKESLRKCIELFDRYLSSDDNTPEQPKEPEKWRSEGDITKITDPKSDGDARSRPAGYMFGSGLYRFTRRHSRMLVMFGVLVAIFAQYLIFFDGQQKISETMPGIYNQVTNSLEELFGG